MHIDIKSLRILSPSPTTFILDVEQTTDQVSGTTNHVTYVGSGEHCFNTSALVNSKLAHSMTFSTTPGMTQGNITAYAMFDLNDLLIGTNTDFNREDTVFNDYIIAPAIENVDDKLVNPITGIVHNKNGFIGVIPSRKKNQPTEPAVLQATPSRKYDSLGYLKYSADKDAITLYDKSVSPGNAKQILRAKNEYDVEQTSLSGVESSKLDQIFVVQTFHAFDTAGTSQQPNQNITANWSLLVNNFDNGVLSVASFITPKQTLNSEYSTTKSMLNDTTPYKYMRDYTVDGEFNMYASGNLLLFNYLEAKSLSAGTTLTTPTQISTTYSAFNGLPDAKFGTAYTRSIVAAPNNITDNVVYQNYLPEVVNLVDDGYGGSGGSGTVGAKRAIHKANIFDIEIASGAVTKEPKYNTVMTVVPTYVAAAYDRANDGNSTDITAKIKTALHKHISDRLQSLVSDLIPAHTHLYRVVTNDVDGAGIEPDAPNAKHPFSIINGMLVVNYDVENDDLPYSIIFNDDSTGDKVEMTISIINGEIALQITPTTTTADSINTIVLSGTRKYSGTYRLYAYNGEIAFRRVSYDFVPVHPFTIINGILNATYQTDTEYDDIIFADVSNDQLIKMSLALVNNEVEITLVPIANDDTLKVVTTLPITGTGTSAGDYILYINNGNVHCTYVKQS